MDANRSASRLALTQKALHQPGPLADFVFNPIRVMGVKSNDILQMKKAFGTDARKFYTYRLSAAPDYFTMHFHPQTGCCFQRKPESTERPLFHLEMSL